MRILAEIEFYERAGDRKGMEFHSGYRPAFKFKDSLEFHSGRILFSNQERTKPNTPIEGFIEFLYPDQVVNYLSIGVEFQFFEGDNIMGKCKILRLLGPSITCHGKKIQ